jgi:hypothetical protein
MRRLGWAGLAVAALMLAGCTDDASSTATPADPTSPPTTASTSAEPSPTPDDETPEEFVRRWVAEYNAMQNSGDTETFRGISRKCETCIAVADRMDRYYGAGGYVKTDGLTIQTLRVSKPNDKGQRAVTIAVEAAPVEYVEKQGGQVQSLPGGSPTYQLSLTPRGKTWNVFEIFQKARLPQ